MSPTLSIVTTLYQSAPYLREFHERITKAALAITDRYDIIMVNDGSPDDSLNIALELQKTDPRLTIIDLSRNFGHHNAIMAGLEHAEGELVFLIDCDLEEDPDLLRKFYITQQDEQCDVVFGIVCKRKKRWLVNQISNIALNLYKKLSDIKSPKDQATIRLMTLRYVKSLLEFPEKELFLEGLFYLTGYTQIGVSIEKQLRNTSSYTLSKRIRLFVTALSSFSNAPLVYMFYVGLLIFCSSLIMSFLILIKKFFFLSTMPGWISVIISTWLLGGLIICCLGIVSIYISKLFIEVKGRPRVIVRSIYSQKRINKGNF